MTDTEANYWDSVWSKRIYPQSPKSVGMNKPKMKGLILALIMRPYYLELEKLDIGGGTGIHHGIINTELDGWTSKLALVDYSEVAVAKARLFNINAYLGSFYDFNPGKKFDVFFFLDSLEHFEYLSKVSEKIAELGRGDFYIFGNVPLYSQDSHDKCEWPINREVMSQFFWSLGIDSWRNHIYGSYGYPYMMFEAQLNHVVPDFGGRMEKIRIVPGNKKGAVKQVIE